MRRPPKKRTAPGASRGGVQGLKKANWTQLDSPSLQATQESIFTAIPCGSDWRVKALSADGEVALLGRFENRLSALGAALLMSAQAGGRAIP